MEEQKLAIEYNERSIKHEQDKLNDKVKNEHSKKCFQFFIFVWIIRLSVIQR